MDGLCAVWYAQIVIYIRCSYALWVPVVAETAIGAYRLSAVLTKVEVVTFLFSGAVLHSGPFRKYRYRLRLKAQLFVSQR